MTVIIISDGTNYYHYVYVIEHFVSYRHRLLCQKAAARNKIYSKTLKLKLKKIKSDAWSLWYMTQT